MAARPVTTTNFILEKLRKAGIIGKTEEKLAQVYTGYETDDMRYRAVCRSYLIDYYCAVLTDQKRVEKLKVLPVFYVEQPNNILTAIKESSTSGVAEDHKTMLQSYLDKKRLSCVRAKALGLPDAEAQCLTYIQDLEAFLAYVPESKFIVDVSFVRTINRPAYHAIQKKIVNKDYLPFYLQIDLPEHKADFFFTLDEAKELDKYQTKIDELKNNGGFAISFGNGRDGYKTTFQLLDMFIQAKWNITNVEMMYPGNITFSSINEAPKNIEGTSSTLDKTEYTISALKEIDKKSPNTLEMSDYFNGTMLITLERGAQKLTIWTLASREDFHDIAFVKKIRKPDDYMINDKFLESSFMRKSIYTTDLYHVLRYAIEKRLTNSSTLEFQTEEKSKEKQTKQYLYPSKATGFTRFADIDDKIKDTTSPAILLDRFNTTFNETKANKIHVFATLPQQVELPKQDKLLLTPDQTRYMVATMKTIAYANRLRYPKPAVKAGGQARHKS